MTFPLFNALSSEEALMEIKNPYSMDNVNLFNVFPFSDESMEKQDINQVNVSQPILTLRGHPPSNNPLFTPKDYLSITLKGEPSDSLDYHALSHTYNTRNNPQPTTYLLPSQPFLPLSPHFLKILG